MKEIILTDEQARQISESTGRVRLLDPAGNFVFDVDPFLGQALAAHIKRKASGEVLRGFPGHVVRRHLDQLQVEWDRLGGFDKEYCKQFMDKLQAEDAHELL